MTFLKQIVKEIGNEYAQIASDIDAKFYFIWEMQVFIIHLMIFQMKNYTKNTSGF